jgi:hypothetical protein
LGVIGRLIGELVMIQGNELRIDEIIKVEDKWEKGGRSLIYIDPNR